MIEQNRILIDLVTTLDAEGFGVESVYQNPEDRLDSIYTIKVKYTGNAATIGAFPGPALPTGDEAP